MAFRDVEALGEKFGIAEYFDITASEFVNEVVSDKSGSLSVDVRGGNTGVDETI